MNSNLIPNLIMTHLLDEVVEAVGAKNINGSSLSTRRCSSCRQLQCRVRWRCRRRPSLDSPGAGLDELEHLISAVWATMWIKSSGELRQPRPKRGAANLSAARLSLCGVGAGRDRCRRGMPRERHVGERCRRKRAHAAAASIWPYRLTAARALLGRRSSRARAWPARTDMPRCSASALGLHRHLGAATPCW